jgi:hypothetical protein
MLFETSFEGVKLGSKPSVIPGLGIMVGISLRFPMTLPVLALSA